MTPGLSLVLHSGAIDRVWYALSLAVSAAAVGRGVAVLVAGRAVPLLLAEPGWQGLDADAAGRPPAAHEAAIAARGAARMAELLEACRELGVRFILCETAAIAAGLEDAALDPALAVERAGIMAWLEATPPGTATLFV